MTKLKRPLKKYAAVKVSEKDMICFSLGIDIDEFILPSQQKNYQYDKRVLALLQDIKNGKSIANRDLSGYNFKGADISGVDFSNCILKNATFYNTKANKCQFTNADFSNAYIENSDFNESDFTNCTLNATFINHNDFNLATIDKKGAAYITSLTQLIELIESGKLDLKTLSLEDLRHLDLRVLDFSHIDMSGIDLSVFDLEGVNLSGTYIDEKALDGRNFLEKTYLDIKNMQANKAAALHLRIMAENQQQLAETAQIESDKKPTRPIKPALIPLKKPRLKRPAPKIKKEILPELPPQPFSIKITNKLKELKNQPKPILKVKTPPLPTPKIPLKPIKMDEKPIPLVPPIKKIIPPKISKKEGVKEIIEVKPTVKKLPPLKTPAKLPPKPAKIATKEKQIKPPKTKEEINR